MFWKREWHVARTQGDQGQGWKGEEPQSWVSTTSPGPGVLEVVVNILEPGVVAT